MKTRFKKNADACGICLEEIEFQGIINCCQHLFCLKCIKKWSEVNYRQSENSCPVCKKRFNSIANVSRRKEYKQSKRKLHYVKTKNQERVVSQSEFIMLLQAASNILTSELNNLLDLSS